MDDVKNWIQVQRALPSAYQDSVNGAMRAGRYGEPIVQALQGGKVSALAEEGSYFVTRNATTGTGIASTANVTAFSATSPFLYLYNGSTTKSVTLDYLKLQVTAAGTNGTALWYQMNIDNIARWTSGGTALGTPACTNMSTTTASGVTGYAGAIVAPAASAYVRALAGGAIRLVIPVVGDQYLFTFGSSAPGPIGTLALAGTAIASWHSPAPPVVLGPGHTFLLYLWLPSQSGASSYEYEVGFWER